jgi:hypothetical protein
VEGRKNVVGEDFGGDGRKSWGKKGLWRGWGNKMIKKRVLFESFLGPFWVPDESFGFGIESVGVKSESRMEGTRERGQGTWKEKNGFVLQRIQPPRRRDAERGGERWSG